MPSPKRLFRQIVQSAKEMAQPRELLPPERFKGPPVSVEEFAHHKDFLGLPTLGPRQIGILEKFFAPDATYSELVLLWGKGSGKDHIAGVIVCYVVYCTWLLEDPQKYYGLAPGSHIDIVNVAQNADQAQHVFFEGSLKAKLKNSPWFKSPQVGFRAYRNIVRFPKGIRAISAHSQNESFEGLNILVFVMDEAAAFRSETKTANADKIYSTLRSSMMSRFEREGRGCILSYPRRVGDFILKKYASELNDEQFKAAFPWILRDRGATWEIHPHKTREGLADEYLRDPIDAQAKYECFAPLQIDAALPPELVHKCIGGVNLEELAALPLGPKYVVSLDTAFQHDRFARIVGHIPAGKTVVVDSVRLWDPRKLGTEVQMAPIEDEISIFCKRTNAKVITGIHSITSSIQRWQNEGIFTQKIGESIREQQEQFTEFKKAMQVVPPELQYPNEPELLRELTRLKLSRGDSWKPEAGEGEYDDLADALIRLVWMLRIGRLERRGDFGMVTRM